MLTDHLITTSITNEFRIDAVRARCTSELSVAGDIFVDMELLAVVLIA